MQRGNCYIERERERREREERERREREKERKRESMYKDVGTSFRYLFAKQ